MQTNSQFSGLYRFAQRHPRTVGCLVPPIVLASLLALALAACHHSLARKRATWMAETLPRLAALSDRDPEISSELATLRDQIAQGETPNWAGNKVLLMTNGQYLICAYRHGANEGWPHHLLLARGSDGRWFYSSFHFCNGFAMIQGDPPPGSIDDFKLRYGVREFDGKSDVCLETTWPP